MKWTPEQIEELKTLCAAGDKNASIAAHFSVPVTEIHAKRSQLGITMPKIAAAKGLPAIAPNPTFENALPETAKPEAVSIDTSTGHYNGLEIFSNAGSTCIVLARTGDIALIVIPAKSVCQFVVPLEHKTGTQAWWQGHYFNSLGEAWAYYITLISMEETK